MATTKGGCVLINLQEKKVALIYRPHKNDYSFPKGHIEPGEGVKDCAIRETIEETARDISLLMDEPICKDKYFTGSGEEVECIFYLAKDNGEFKGEIAEIDREICEWYNVEEVEEKLTYRDLKEMWEKVRPIVLEAFN